MREDCERLLAALHRAMITFDRGDPRRIQHLAKVHGYARLIGTLEGLDPKTLFTLEAAAYVHDIGIHIAEEKLGYQNGKLQEELGPAAARDLLARLGFPEEVIGRVTWLVAHHHTYAGIDAPDYQILVEADFLVNIFESEDAPSNRASPAMQQAARNARDRIFATRSGIALANDMFGLDPE